RGRGAGPGDLHAAPRLPRGVRRVGREAKAQVRLIDDDDILVRDLLVDAIVEHAWQAAGAAFASALAIERLAADSGRALGAVARELARQGILRLVVSREDGGLFEAISWRAICLARERLARASPLIELAFAMQGLGSYPISLAGDGGQRAKWLPGVARGE